MTTPDWTSLADLLLRRTKAKARTEHRHQAILARADGDLLPSEEGMTDQWWPASEPDDPPVNMIVLGVAHHHATGHLCGGGGCSFDCEDCDFAIDDGVVLAGGWVRLQAEKVLDADER